jgi:hypothetical protein
MNIFAKRQGIIWGLLIETTSYILIAPEPTDSGAINIGGIV